MKIKNYCIIVYTFFSYINNYSCVEFIINKYNDVQAIIIEHTKSHDAFEQYLIDLLQSWQANGYKAVWLTIPTQHAQYIPIVLQHNFVYHHATSEKLVMIHALKEGAELQLPAHATQTLGAFGIVLDNDNNILVVKERFKPELGYKLPGGGADFSEDISTVAIREIKEETGIDCEFLGIVAWRHGHSIGHQAISDMCFCCLLKPLSHDIKIQETEIIDACWMPYTKFKKIARNICAQFLVAYEAAGAPYVSYSVNALGLLMLYAPKTINLTQVVASDSQ